MERSNAVHGEAGWMDAGNDERLAAVRALAILDTEAEAVFDEAALLASTICGTPVSLVTVLDDKRQWFKAKVGVELTETPIEYAFCAYAIKQDELFIVPDATLDLRFCDNPLVTGDLGVRFYAGMPLRTAEDHAIGTLCVLDTQPRELTDAQRASLSMLGRQVARQINLRSQMNALNQTVARMDFIEQKISSSNALFRMFMDTSPLLGFVKDEEGRMLYYNRPFADLFHIGGTDWIGKTDFDVYPHEAAAEYRLDDVSVLEGGELLIREQNSPGENGQIRHWRTYKFRFVNDQGARFLAGMSLEITKEKEAEAELTRSHDQLYLANEQLRELTVTDALTGLCNRRGFDERLRQEFLIASRYGFHFSMLLLDVDHFKSMNDTFGHDAGDEVLRKIAQVLARCGRTSDLVCRYGGEEFAFLLPGTSLKQAMLLGNRVRRTIADTAWEKRPITISVGASSNDRNRVDVLEMVRMADLALYEAKTLGRNRVASYRPELEVAAMPCCE